MSSKKIIITGALGQDGRILSKILVKKGYRVFGFINKNYKSPVKKVKYKKINLKNTKNLKKELSIIKPTHIVHFGSSNPSYGSKGNFYKENYKCTKNIIDSIISVNNSIKLIFPNSSQIFKKKKIVSEKDKFVISSSYTKFRIDIFKYMKSMKKKKKFNFTNLILFNHDSRYRSKRFLLPRLIQGVKRKKINFLTEIFKENISADFSHAEDICNAIYLLIKKNTNYDNLILSSKKVTKINDIIFYLLKKYLPDQKIKAKTKINKDYIIGNNSLAKKELRWKIKKNIFIAADELAN
tara:strand:+ start:1316 stop:2200 length:885 start_codon:yes stop_codon:yes gene_type:complete